MSAFLVSTLTMHDVVGLILTTPAGSEDWHRPLLNLTAEEMMQLSERGLSREGPEATQLVGTRIGRDLFRLNNLALKWRYGDEPDPIEDEYVFDAGVAAHVWGHPRRSYHWYGAPGLQAIKSAACLLYQCSEGDAVHDASYLGLQAVIAAAHASVVAGLPAYDAAKWGRYEGEAILTGLPEGAARIM